MRRSRMKLKAAKGEQGKKTADKVLSDIYKAIHEIAYGSVQIHIQDGRVVQIDKINKVRMR
jgi:hypothetical protein